MKWLKNHDCLFDKSTFSSAARTGNLINMKWLKNEKCPYSENTFSSAAEHGDPVNMNWLRENDHLFDKSLVLINKYQV